MPDATTRLSESGCTARVPSSVPSGRVRRGPRPPALGRERETAPPGAGHGAHRERAFRVDLAPRNGPPHRIEPNERGAGAATCHPSRPPTPRLTVNLLRLVWSRWHMISWMYHAKGCAGCCCCSRSSSARLLASRPWPSPRRRPGCFALPASLRTRSRSAPSPRQASSHKRCRGW